YAFLSNGRLVGNIRIKRLAEEQRRACCVIAAERPGITGWRSRHAGSSIKSARGLLPPAPHFFPIENYFFKRQQQKNTNDSHYIHVHFTSNPALIERRYSVRSSNVSSKR